MAAKKRTRTTVDREAPRGPDALLRFSPATREWFEATLGEPTEAQARGWASILDGQSTLLVAPTGSGKTLAAFLAAIDRLVTTIPPKEGNAAAKEARCRVLYVSPLKALAVDIERNLRAPIAGIAETARRLGETPHLPTIGVRTGDTPQAERTRMRRSPPDILITTPESLYLMLTSDSRSVLLDVDTVIVDEIHSVVPTKRGVHLFVTLERLESLRRSKSKLQRIGLSATQRPLDEVSRLLGGFDDEGAPRPVTIVDAQKKRPLELRVELPDPGMGQPEPELDPLEQIASGSATIGTRTKSIWPKVHERLVEIIRQNRTTMIFVNSRRLAERLASAVNEVAGEELALAHHGSVARDKRQVIEERLKRGLLPAIVATSSLELGLDIGSVEMVVQVEAPPSVASGLQRVGRANHDVRGTPRGILVPKHKADLLACAAATVHMAAGDVEATFYPRNALDVLAQQIVAMCAVEPLPTDALYARIRRAAPYAELPRSAFEGVLDMLSGRYPSDDFAELRPRLVWDRVAGIVRAREGARRLAVTNGGTIPDRGLYGVFLVGEGDGGRGGKRVGELDEEMVFELREGEVFLLGASSWRAESITHDRVLVSPALGEPGKMPFWHGDRPGRPRAFGTAIGALTRTLSRLPRDEAETYLRERHALDTPAATALVDYVHEQYALTGEVPSDRAIVIERFLDEVGDHRVCVMTPFGARVHAPWATAVATRLSERYAGEVESVWSDDGMVFRIPASDEPPDAALFLPPSTEVEDVVTRSLEGTSLFAARFREAAGRALLLPRKSPTMRQPLWAQRKRAQDLLAVASRHPSFPIVLEAYRECLRDVFDLSGLVGLLRDVEGRKIRVTTVDTTLPSPFASSLLFAFVANFIYEGDAPLAERRAQALTIDHAKLRELLGEAELRALLDPDVLEEHEAMLQRKLHPAKSADSLNDVLRTVGDLTLDEVKERVATPDDALSWLEALERERRVFRFRIQKGSRFAAVEEAARLRDAVGIAVPAGLPRVFLEPARDAVFDLVARYARTHGPFVPEAIVKRYGLARGTVDAAIARLVRDGKAVRGAFLPARAGERNQEEVCDAEVLRAIRRKSLARLRREVEPVEPTAYARFLAAWHALDRPRFGEAALLEAVAQLEGCPLPASTLLRDILPARIEGFRPSDLDALTASGEIVWAGIEPIGPNDGRIALYLEGHEPALARDATPVPGETAAAIRSLLERRGAVFFSEIARTVGGFPNDLLATLWDMVFAGEVTNDTLEPLRSLLRGAERDNKKHRPRARPARSGPPGSEGRWSLRAARWGERPSVTERRAALARALLERYGVVTREAAHAESIVGGFSAVYDVYKAMEDGGRVRRGYFVAGHGGAQFALPGADERLRARRDEDATPERRVLAATDPANPYGALLPWPARDGESDAARPQRAAGAYVVLVDGALRGYLGRGGSALSTFVEGDTSARLEQARGVAEALLAWARARGKAALVLRTIDGLEPREHPLAAAMLEAGFALTGSGLVLRAKPPAERRMHA
jgi:ATP-dependent Lhr-like helicase